MQPTGTARCRNAIVLLAAFGVFFATVFPLAPTPIAVAKNKLVAPAVSVLALAIALLATVRAHAVLPSVEPIRACVGPSLLDLTCSRLC